MYKCSAFLTAFLLIISPITATASHNSGVSTSSLDDDIVEEIPIPVLFGVTYAEINPDFGDPRGGGTRSHEGEDFLAPKGAPIVSPTKAVVLRTGTGPSAGKYVYTANPGGEVFRYMHLDYIAELERGDKLDVGYFIGTVGDTGNAPDGVYHLHFEVREDGSTPVDPYPRLTDEFTLKEKISFLADIFKDIKDDEEYAEFLVSTFTEDFREALKQDYNLPNDIEDALEDLGVVSDQSSRSSLEATLKTIPKAVTTELSEGDQSVLVTLLQIYLIYMNEGEARDNLLAAGPTGYFGPVTAAAVAQVQSKNSITETGVYDSATRVKMLGDTKVALNI